MCQKCASLWTHKLESGASVLSVGQDHKTGKIVVLKGDGSGSQDSKTRDRRPSGFTSWRIDD
jgi:hypothetical protein